MGLLIGLLTACSTTKTNSRHPLIQPTSSAATSEYAKVYFIRPNTEHMQGFPDNPLKVFLNDTLLLELGKGEYTLIYLKPGKGTLTLENLTQIRGRWEVEPMRRTRNFDFHSDQTYFLVTRPIDGEFRGVHFMPELVPQTEAQTISQHLRATGQASQHPLKGL